MTTIDPKSTKIELNVGDLAPTFVGIDQNGTSVDLAQILQTQKVLLIFYPGDDTPGCTTQLCEIRDIYDEFKKLNVRVFGVNQGKKDSHNKFISKFNFPFGLIQDNDREIAQKYGAIGKFFAATITKRGAFLIDNDGKILFKHWGMQNNEEILKLLTN